MQLATPFVAWSPARSPGAMRAASMRPPGRTSSLVPLVRAFYARQSVYLWWDGAGACHRMLQGDGCEQGDALAPALFALAQHAALVGPGGFLAAFLDDLYIVTVPNRARAALEAVFLPLRNLPGLPPT